MHRLHTAYALMLELPHLLLGSSMHFEENLLALNWISTLVERVQFHLNFYIL